MRTAPAACLNFLPADITRCWWERRVENVTSTLAWQDTSDQRCGRCLLRALTFSYTDCFVGPAFFDPSAWSIATASASVHAHEFSNVRLAVSRALFWCCKCCSRVWTGRSSSLKYFSSTLGGRARPCHANALATVRSRRIRQCACGLAFSNLLNSSSKRVERGEARWPSGRGRQAIQCIAPCLSGAQPRPSRAKRNKK